VANPHRALDWRRGGVHAIVDLSSVACLGLDVGSYACRLTIDRFRGCWFVCEAGFTVFRRVEDDTTWKRDCEALPS
jgi:hypothetical protein